MRNTTTRVLLFAVAIPMIAALILLLPGYSHAALNAVVTLAAALGAVELASMFEKLGLRVKKSLAAVLAASVPAAAYAEVAGLVRTDLVGFVIALGVTVAGVAQIIPRREGGFKHALGSFAGTAAVLLYPGLLAAYVVRISALPSASAAYLVFLVTVFANDTSAYVFGVLLGGKTAGVVAVSPKKSVVGFVAGILAALGSSLVSFRFLPAVFGCRLWAAFAAGAAVALMTVLGDLVESALKRSAGVKDSGTIIPGRGGLLDSVDSILLSAPAFVFIIQLATGSA